MNHTRGGLHSESNTPFINTLRPRPNGGHFADDIFKCIFMYENIWISIKISLKFVPKGPISNIPALVQLMAWRRPGDKPLSEPMMIRLRLNSLGLNELSIRFPSEWQHEQLILFDDFPISKTKIISHRHYIRIVGFNRCCIYNHWWHYVSVNKFYQQITKKSDKASIHVYALRKRDVLLPSVAIAFDDWDHH